MKKNIQLFLLAGLVASVGFTACSEEDTTVTPTTPTDTSAVLVEYTTGVVWNLQAPVGKLGAWDFVTNAGVSSSGAPQSKDIIDMSSVDPTIGVIFPKTWTTSNGTTFVKANNFNYAGATQAKADTAFLAGTATSTTGVLATGDVYIAKNARYSHSYVVIRVGTINVTTTDNLDNIEFTYKK
jgi:hypothetical protein